MYFSPCWLAFFSFSIKYLGLCSEEEVGSRGPPAFGRNALEQKASAQLVYTHVCVLYVHIYGWIHGCFAEKLLLATLLNYLAPVSLPDSVYDAHLFQLLTTHAYTQTPLVQPHIQLQVHS